MTNAARSVATTLLIVIAIACTVLAFGASTDARTRFAIGVTAFLLFLAAGTVGATLGFLFGLPRSRLADQLMPAQTTATSQHGATTNNVLSRQLSTSYLTNSNLNKVSDWLTTIIVGLGLVNLGRFIPAIREFATALRQPLGGAPYAGAAAVSLLVIGLLAGLIIFYLWTSIRVRGLLEEAETQAVRVPKLEGRTVDEVMKQFATDTPLQLDSEQAPGGATIQSQETRAGEIVRPGTTITVKAS
jgi:hypothetical protein